MFLRFSFSGRFAFVIFLIVAGVIWVMVFQRQSAGRLHAIPFHDLSSGSGMRREANRASRCLGLLWHILCAAKADVWVVFGGISLGTEGRAQAVCAINIGPTTLHFG